MTSDLITRLSKLDGQSREVDAEIATYFDEHPGEGWELITHQPGAYHMDAGSWIKGNIIRTPKPYTASVDAAIALAARKLPGWTWTLQPTYAEVRHPKLRAKDKDGFGKNPAIALCIAILRAKEAGHA